ncbi:MAG: PAS domain S-box protein [Deltaproteobacteria bacterium]|nr:PAS domain S-box protein [Deltaproteobacteria bacterium]
MDGRSLELVSKNIFEALQEGLLLIGPGGTVINLNPAAERILGIRREELQGKSWGQILLAFPQNDDFNQAILDIVQNRGVQAHKEVSYLCPDGTERQLLLITSYLENPDHHGQVLAVSVLLHDQSELYALREQERKLINELKRLYQLGLMSLTRISQGVAHELRNPVMTIGGFARRLARKLPGDEQLQSYIKYIIDSAERLEKLVQRVQEFCELPEPVLLPEEVVEVVTEAAAPFAEMAKNQGVKLIFENNLPPDYQHYLDRRLIIRALASLIRNALEAMPGGGTLTLRTGVGLHWLMIEVIDTGGGIRPEDRPFIFNPFFSTNPAKIGMDLTIAERILWEHRGNIFLENLPGQGATFGLYLPIVQPGH